MKEMTELRKLPSVDVLARDPLLSGYPEKLRTQAAREAVNSLRQEAREGKTIDLSSAAEVAERFAQSLANRTLQPAINLSGVVLHTGLGRARLAPYAVAHLNAVASAHAAVEFDLEDGTRGDRQERARELLRELTGAEDALVVNNAAAGVFLSLTALCSGTDVVLSRGQMVEIGGSFRMPDIVRQSGCNLVEVGCTNKTRVSDFEEVVWMDTGAILRCHPSNYKIIGFTAEPTLEELAELAHERGTIVIDDQGSGCLIDTTQFGLPPQATLQSSVKGGADITIASGDKLLGGPQAGLIIGRSEYIETIKSHPLARAVRVDKLTLAALEATLRLYTHGRELEIPTLRYLSRPLSAVRRDALKISRAVPNSVVSRGATEVGGGSAPGTGVPTWRVGLPGKPDELAKKLRSGSPPIIGRIEQDRVWLDPRTLEQGEMTALLNGLKRALTE